MELLENGYVVIEWVKNDMHDWSICSNTGRDSTSTLAYYLVWDLEVDRITNIKKLKGMPCN